MCVSVRNTNIVANTRLQTSQVDVDTSPKACFDGLVRLFVYGTLPTAEDRRSEGKPVIKQHHRPL